MKDRANVVAIYEGSQDREIHSKARRAQKAQRSCARLYSGANSFDVLIQGPARIVHSMATNTSDWPRRRYALVVAIYFVKYIQPPMSL